MKKLNRKGFTLVELLAVIVVTSLVLGLSGYGIINAYKSAKEKTVVLNETSIMEAARIYSSEANSYDWKELNNSQYFCTTIQRLKNVGLLKKEATSEKYGDSLIITVVRDATKYTINSIDFLEDDATELKDLCDIKFFTIHYEYNTDGDNQNLPIDQMAEICTEENCMVTYVSPLKPKRVGYRFVSWNTEPDGTGVSYLPGDAINSYSEDIITLYAQWKEDNYTINYNANTNGAEGSTPSTTCVRGKNCTLSENGFSKDGYKFIGWNTKSDLSGKTYKDKDTVHNLTSSDSVTLYAMWKAKYKAVIKFNAGEGAFIKSPTTSEDGVKYLWKKATDGIISRSIDNGSTYTDSFFSILYNEEKDLPNYNNEKYMKITNSGFIVSTGSVWKCISGECLGKTYNQVDNYNSDSFCNAKEDNCTVVLSVNWESSSCLSPIITPSDGIASENWHNNNYTLNVTSENVGKPSYEYKIGDGNYQTYSNPISPAEGIYTYTAKTKIGSTYSGEVQYISKLDLTPPSAPIIDNPSNEEWVNYSFSLTLHSTDNLSGIAYYQYRYEGHSWHTYENSAADNFVTTPFSKERNELVYVRACDKAGNCSEENSTYIRIDKTKPTISFGMKHNNNVVSPSSNEYSLMQASVPKWINYVPKLEWTSVENGSGIKEQAFSYNKTNLNSLNSNPLTRIVYNGDQIKEPFAIDVSSSGYRHVKFETCDEAGNCAESNVFLRLDFIKPTFTVNVRKDGADGEIVNLDSNIYGLSSSDDLKWINNSLYLEWDTIDSLSGININLKDNISYNKTGLSTLSTDINSTASKTGDSNGKFSVKMSSSGYRYVKFNICDNVGNCTDSEVFFKIDKVPPSVDFQMINGNTVASSTYYSSTPSDNLKWFTFKPTLRWIATDKFSGINTMGRYYFNNHSSESLNEAFPTVEGYSLNGVLNGNSYVFNNPVDNGGYRKYKATICDNVGNCTDDIKYFKYYANSAVGRYVNSSNGINCRSGPSTGNSVILYFGCGAYLSGIVKSYTGNWYYSTGSNCYVNGDYLVTSKPNCSSGGGSSGGSGTAYNCTCIKKSDCNSIAADSSMCINGICQYYDRDGNSISFTCK